VDGVLSAEDVRGTGEGGLRGWTGSTIEGGDRGTLVD